MDAIGFSLNLVTLLAITLVTGILVDDAIVEIENIERHMRMGKSAYRASLEAADEIGLAVIAISLSIAAIFSPVSFMGGIAGQSFRQFGLTVAIAVMFSLVVARLVTPVIAAYFLRAARRGTCRRPGHVRLYAPRRSLRAPSLDHAVRCPSGTSSGCPARPRASRRSSFAAHSASSARPVSSAGMKPDAVELPPGSRLDDTDRVTRAISEKLRAIAEVRSSLIFGGQILGGGAEPRKATFVINFVDKSERAAARATPRR